MRDTHWQVQDAKQRFSELVRRAQTDGAQVVTKHGTEVAVVLGMAEYHRLTGVGTDLKAYLLGGPRAELTITRSSEPQHEIDLSEA